MILTASKAVNVRLGKPSVNADNPSFLIEGDQVNAITRVLGDIVNDDNEWIFTDKNTFVSAAGFPPQEKIHIPLDISNSNFPLVFRELEIGKLWDTFKSKGDDISVGIIDNGVARNTFLNNKVVPVNYEFSSIDALENHGTYMASIISAYDFSSGKVGIAPFIKNIYSYKIANFSQDEILIAIDNLAKLDVNIINMSFSSNGRHDDFVAVERKINELNDANIICTCSSGNESIQSKVYPAGLNGIISVAGYKLAIPKRSWNGSNIWSGINICAPYNSYFNIPFLNTSNTGTSTACAVITGILACCFGSIQQKAKSKSKSVYKYLQEDLFPLLPKIDFLNDISIPAFSTSEFINIIK